MNCVDNEIYFCYIEQSLEVSRYYVDIYYIFMLIIKA